MVEILNKNKYLTPDLVDKCFDIGKHNYVDKVLCGNGFSTAFLTENPDEGKINIMIAPNKAVLQDKERAYIDGKINTNNIIKFIYADSTDKSWDDADVLMFIIDSFIIHRKNVKTYSNIIGRVLIDEFHSLYQQSLFRPRLIDFDTVVDDIFLDKSSIVSVTATPNKYTQEITHIIRNKKIPKTEIHLTYNKEESFLRLKEAYDNGDKIVVATHDTKLIVNLGERKEIRANFIIGESLMAGLSKKMKVIQDTEAPLIIISSKGFEGGDIYGKGYKVWFFEDRGHIHETFFISNLYQALNRVREGVDYVEYCRNTLSKSRNTLSERAIMQYINRRDLSPEKKLSSKYDKYRRHIIETEMDNGDIDIKFNNISHGLEKEKLEYDKGFKYFKEFLNDRNIKIINIDVDNVRDKRQRFSRNHKIDMMLQNKELLDLRGIFKEKHTLQIKEFDKFVQYYNHIDEWVIEKNYDGEYEYTERNLITMELIEDYNIIETLSEDMSKIYSEKSIDKYGYKDSKIYRDKFEKESLHYVMKLIQMLTNENIYTSERSVAHREYNLLTKVTVKNIKKISDIYNIKMTEIDIKSAFPRIAYALSGLPLPSRIYGDNKKNKIGVNASLNMIWYNRELSTGKGIQKTRAVDRLSKYNIDNRVIDFLIKEFFESNYKGDLFNKLAFHEKKIIHKLKKEVTDKNPNLQGMIRRHDSLIVFGEVEDLSFLPEFEYLNQIGWFG